MNESHSELAADDNRELVRGTVIAVLFIVVATVVISAVAFLEPWKQVGPVLGHASAPPPPRAAPKPVVSKPLRPPLNGDDKPDSPASPGAAPLAQAGTPADAGQALREALLAYRAKPNTTSTVTISTRGGVQLGERQALTYLDGLSRQSVRDSLLISGGAVSQPAN